MRIFNEIKTQELKDVDLNKGYLKNDTLFIRHIDGVEEQTELREDPERKGIFTRVITVQGVEERDEYEDIQIYVPYTEEELKARTLAEIRSRRQVECFNIVNRGKLWYDKLLPAQVEELNRWYEAWLDAPETLVTPKRPYFLDVKLEQGEDIL